MGIGAINTASTLISVDRLAEALEYNAETGELVWRVRPRGHFDSDAHAARWNGKYAGKPAFTSACPRGYYRGALDGVTLYAHRVAVALTSGAWPETEVDHINRNKSDNRASNLRVVSHSANRRNTPDAIAAHAKRLEKERRKAERKSKHPIPGVRRQSPNSWAVRVKKDGQERHIGSFRCFGEAVSARRSAT